MSKLKNEKRRAESVEREAKNGERKFDSSMVDGPWSMVCSLWSVACFNFVIIFYFMFSLTASAEAGSAADDSTSIELVQTELVKEESAPAQAPASPPPQELMPSFKDFGSVTYPAEILVQINRSLKNSLEENRKLREENQRLERELGQLRGQRAIQSGNLITVTEQRDQLDQHLKVAEVVNTRSMNRINELQDQFTLKGKEYEQKIKELGEELGKQKEALVRAGDAATGKTPSVGASHRDAATGIPPVETSRWDVSSDTSNIMANIDRLNQENERLTTDSAKVHYNLGNIHFQKGEYVEAAGEYGLAVQLTPRDANAHFNLAYVSGEYLGNYATALEHYRAYLSLNPHPGDRAFVNEKMLEAELILQIQIDSPIDDG